MGKCDFKEEAIRLGLCEEWQRDWAYSDNIEKYLKGIYWCMEREYPSMESMREYDKECLLNGIYNNKNTAICADRDTYVFNGGEITLNVPAYGVCKVFVGRDCKLMVVAEAHSIVFVDSYGCDVECISKDETASFNVRDMKARASASGFGFAQPPLSGRTSASLSGRAKS